MAHAHAVRWYFRWIRGNIEWNFLGRIVENRKIRRKENVEKCGKNEKKCKDNRLEKWSAIPQSKDKIEKKS